MNPGVFRGRDLWLLRVAKLSARQVQERVGGHTVSPPTRKAWGAAGADKTVGKASILLADDHAPFLASMRRLLEPAFEITGEVQTGEALLAAAGRLKPDVAVVDIVMPGLSGIEATRRLKRDPALNVAVVIITSYGEPALVEEALAAGALGYVLKTNAAEDLIPAIEHAIDGRTFLSGQFRTS